MFPVTLEPSSTQTFSRYLNYKKDNNELLLFLLRQLIADQTRFHRNRYGDVSDEYAQIQEKELSEKVVICCIN